MDKLNLSPRHRLLSLWLISIACQAGQLPSLIEASNFYDDYAFESPPYPIPIEVPPGDRQPNPSRKDQNYQSWNFSQNAGEQDIPYFEPVSYPPESPSYPQNTPQNGQWPAFSRNEYNQSLPDDWENLRSSQTRVSNSAWTEYNPSPPSSPVEANPESEWRNFTSFDLPRDSSEIRTEHPLSEEGQANSYHFDGFSTSADEHLNQDHLQKKNAFDSVNEEEQSLNGERDAPQAAEPPYLENQKSSSLTPSTQQFETAPDLSQEESNIKIFKKEQTTVKPKENVIGKQIIAAPVVGAILDEDSELKNFEIKDAQNQTASPVEKIYLDSNIGKESTEAKESYPREDLNNSSDPDRNSSIATPTATSSDPLTQQPDPIAPPPPRAPTIITPTSPDPNAPANSPQNPPLPKNEISINFNNVAMIEYIRFISRISYKNFVFNDEDLQFNVSIVSEEPTTVENLMAALLQELKIRDLSLMEQGNNIIIYRNPRVRSPARIVADGTELISSRESELVTRVFRLNTLDPVKASEIIRPLLSEEALVEVLRDTNNLIITDLVANNNKIAQLIGNLDAPNSGITIGQYVVRNTFVDSLVDLANKILQPIAQGNPYVLVPHPVSNSVYIVSNAFIVEKALAILQNLDMNEGKTKVLSLEKLHPSEAVKPHEAAKPHEAVPIAPSFPIGGIEAEGRIQPPSGYLPGYPTVGYPPVGYPPGALGQPPAPTSAIFGQGRLLPGGIEASTRYAQELPPGHIERTLFFIYKLRYRKGEQIEIALRKIGASLQVTGTANPDLIAAINSSQWIESSNGFIFSGTPTALEKVRELILEIDVPLHQVFIEMLILDTTVADSLTYSVDWINRFGGGTTTGEEGFLDVPPSALSPSVNNFVIPPTGIQTILPNGQSVPPMLAQPLPVAGGYLNSAGFVAGVIGTHLTHHGTRFSSIGALLRAIHTDTKTNILLNPKIITEDNNTAEIFVGETDRYKTQSITTDLGTLVTNNFQFIDVGTTLRVTPLIGNDGIITLEIVQETTAAAPTPNIGAANQDVNLVEVLTKSRTVTKIHVPNGFFVILSGMIRDGEARSYSQIPCLGGIPILGCIGKSQSTTDAKRNLMLFIRPLIVDSDEDLEDITKRQQDVYCEKSKFRRAWNYEIDESLNFLNIKPTDPDEIGSCGGCGDY